MRDIATNSSTHIQPLPADAAGRRRQGSPTAHPPQPPCLQAVLRELRLHLQLYVLPVSSYSLFQSNCSTAFSAIETVLIIKTKPAGFTAAHPQGKAHFQRLGWKNSFSCILKNSKIEGNEAQSWAPRAVVHISGISGISS